MKNEYSIIILVTYKSKKVKVKSKLLPYIIDCHLISFIL